MSPPPARTPARNLLLAVILPLLLIAAGVYAYRDDINLTLLDPKVPFQVYRPPPAPDYALARSWALLPAAGPAASGDADVFFIHPTTYDGGRQWLGDVADPEIRRAVARDALPNYAGPFRSIGPVYAPLYRQASLYALLTPQRTDALEAQAFAYEDVRRAFLHFIALREARRPFVLVGVEQGGLIASRLLRDEIQARPDLRQALAAAYLIETREPADEHAPGAPIPACERPGQHGCVAAWASVEGLDLDRMDRLRGAVVWRRRRLVALEDRASLCFNPLLGGAGETAAPARANLGAANATALEWGARPAFLPHQVGAQCRNGLLIVTRPRSATLREDRRWIHRFAAPGRNLFYADIEADVQRRLAAWSAPVAPAPVAPAPVAPAPAATGLSPSR